VVVRMLQLILDHKSEGLTLAVNMVNITSQGHEAQALRTSAHIRDLLAQLH